MANLNFQVLTIFPELFQSFSDSSLIKKAIDKSTISIDLINIRDFAEPPHFKVDDEIYGGGAGMLLKPEPINFAFQKHDSDHQYLRIALTASGGKFSQSVAEELSKKQKISFLCGRYEGIDQRAIDQHIDLELSIGDFICMGGEIPAMLIMEAVTRLLDSGIGNPDSLLEESFSIKDENDNLLLEAPQYTRPAEYQGLKVPEVLLSGNHQEIAKWRKEESLQRTKKNRPDLI